MRTLALAALLCALPVAAVAQTPGGCLSQAEAEGLITYGLPGIVRNLQAKCAATLPVTAPLISAGAVTAGRYQPDADKAWPTAKAAFDKLAGAPMSIAIGDSATRKLLDSLLERGISGKVKPEQCPAIDQIVNNLQPLSALNMARVVVSFAQLQGNAKSPLRLCPAPVPVVSAGIPK